MAKTKYVYLQIEIRSGEYEFTSKGVHEISSRKDTLKFGRDYAKGFFGGKPFQYDKKQDPDKFWFFNGGEVAAKIDLVKEITKEEFDVLKKFL